MCEATTMRSVTRSAATAFILMFAAVAVASAQTSAPPPVGAETALTTRTMD
jgi:hypothetical protein